MFESDADLAAAQAAERNKLTMPSTEAMARDVDRYWSGRIDGLYKTDHPLSFDGLYQIIYRSSSASVHGSLDPLRSYLHRASWPPTVHLSNEDRIMNYVLGAPVLGIALVVAAEVVDWVDAEPVRRFVDRASAETIRRRERKEREPRQPAE